MLNANDFPSAHTHPLRPLGLYFTALVLFLFSSTLFAVIDLGTYLPLYLTQIGVFLFGAILYERNFAPSSSPTPWIPANKLGMPLGVILVMILTTVLLGFASNLLSALVVELVPALKELGETYQNQVMKILLPDTLLLQIAGALAVALVAPICEEYLFRRTLLTEQLRHQSLTTAVLINGLLFSIMHLNPLTVLPLFFFGVFLAHLTVLTGSILPAILAHIALNTTNGVIVPRLMSPDPAEDIAILEILPALAILSTLSALLWWTTARLIQRHHNPPA